MSDVLQDGWFSRHPVGKARITHVIRIAVCLALFGGGHAIGRYANRTLVYLPFDAPAAVSTSAPDPRAIALPPPPEAVSGRSHRDGPPINYGAERTSTIMGLTALLWAIGGFQLGVLAMTPNPWRRHPTR